MHAYPSTNQLILSYCLSPNNEFSLAYCSLYPHLGACPFFYQAPSVIMLLPIYLSFFWPIADLPILLILLLHYMTSFCQPASIIVLLPTPNNQFSLVYCGHAYLPILLILVFTRPAKQQNSSVILLLFTSEYQCPLDFC